MSEMTIQKRDDGTVVMTVIAMRCNQRASQWQPIVRRYAYWSNNDKSKKKTETETIQINHGHQISFLTLWRKVVVGLNRQIVDVHSSSFQGSASCGQLLLLT